MDLTHLPDNVSILKEIIHSQAATYAEIKNNNSTLERSLTELRCQYNLLEEQFRFLKATIYGRKSEKYASDDQTSQIFLFNEPEEVIETSASEEKTEEVSVASYKRARGGRRSLPAELPRVEVFQD